MVSAHFEAQKPHTSDNGASNRDLGVLGTIDVSGFSILCSRRGKERREQDEGRRQEQHGGDPVGAVAWRALSSLCTCMVTMYKVNLCECGSPASFQSKMRFMSDASVIL